MSHQACTSSIRKTLVELFFFLSFFFFFSPLELDKGKENKTLHVNLMIMYSSYQQYN